MEILLLVGVLSGALVWSVAAVRRKQNRARLLTQIAGHLGGRASATVASGASHGVTVIFQLATRTADSNTEWWTEIDVVVPAAYPLAIHVRRQRWLDRRASARGAVIDLQLGDAAFDDAFVVEAAPEDVAHILLDAPVRSFLMAQQRVELDTLVVGERKVLRLAIHDWIDDVASATAAIDFVAAIGARVRDAYAAVDREVPVAMGGSPYRPQPDDRPARDASAARLAEVAALEATRVRRGRRQKVIGIAVMVVLVAVWLAVISRC